VLLAQRSGLPAAAETHTLTLAQIPSHTHTYQGIPAGVFGGGSGGNNSNNTTQSSGSAGSDGAHNNTQPTIVLNHIIRT